MTEYLPDEGEGISNSAEHLLRFPPSKSFEAEVSIFRVSLKIIRWKTRIRKHLFLQIANKIVTFYWLMTEYLPDEDCGIIRFAKLQIPPGSLYIALFYPCLQARRAYQSHQRHTRYMIFKLAQASPCARLRN